MRIRQSLPILLSVFLLFGLGWADTPASKENTKAEKKASAGESAPTRINWMKYDEGLVLAKKEGKKVFVEFTAKWCGWCKKMHASTFIDPEVVSMMSENYIAVSIDGDSRDTLNIDGWITSEKALAREYRVSSYPTYWFLSAEAEPIAPIKGYRDKSALGNILDYLKDDLYKTTSFEDFLKTKNNK